MWYHIDVLTIPHKPQSDKENDKMTKVTKQARFGGRKLAALLAVVATSSALPFGALNALAWEQAITDTSGYVTLTATDGGGTHSFTVAGHWSDGKAPEAGKKYLVNGGRTFRSPDMSSAAYTFAGDSLTFDNAYMNVKGTGGSLTFTNLQLYACRLANGNAKSTKYLYGNFYVHGTNVTFSGSGSGGTRQFCLPAALHGDADSVIHVVRTPNEADANAESFFAVRLQGNNSDFAGRWVVTGSNIALAASSTLPSVVGTGAHFTLEDDGCLFGTGQVNGDRGGFTNCTIAIRNGGVTGRLFAEGWPTFNGGCAFVGDGASDLKIRNASAGGISGSTFGACSFDGINAIRVRRGSVRTLAGYCQPELPIVYEGESATAVQFLAGYSENVGPVFVTSGAFEIMPGGDGTGTLAVASLALNEKSRFTLDITSDGGSDFVRVKGNLTKPAALTKFPIECRSMFAPADGFSVRLLSAANLGTDYTADDFEMAFTDPFVNNTVHGVFSLVEEDGTNVLVWAATSKPVVYLKGADGAAPTSFNSAGHWSSQAAPTRGYDYVVPKSRLLRIRSAETFAGDSLSIVEGGDLAFNVRGGVVNDLRLFPGGRSTTRNSGAGNGLKGTATVYRGTQPFRFMIETSTPNGANGRTCYLENTFKGDGDLSFEYTDGMGSDDSHRPTHGYPTYFRLLGESPAFTGRIQLAHWAVRTVIADELALGGPTAAFQADRLLFVSNGILRVEADVTLKEPTRGITLSTLGSVSTNTAWTNGGTMEVAAGATLTVSNVITGAGQLRKNDVGALVLAGSNTFSGQFSINKGRVTATHPNALGTGAIAAREETVLRIDTPAGIAKPASFDVVTTGGYSPVSVELAAFDAPSGGVIEATIFDIAGAETFDVSRISVLPGGLGTAYKIDVLTEPSATGLRVYARATVRGLRIIFR